MSMFPLKLPHGALAASLMCLHNKEGPIPQGGVDQFSPGLLIQEFLSSLRHSWTPALTQPHLLS